MKLINFIKNIFSKNSKDVIIKEIKKKLLINKFTQVFQILKNTINLILFKFGYRISKINNSHFKIYKYKNYKEYKETQIFYNKKKICHIWADRFNLKKISNFLNQNYKKKISGICHGCRNGFEQDAFSKMLKNLT